MCCVLFSWLAKQTYFRDITNTDIRQRIYDEKLRMLDDEALPFAIIDDGQHRRRCCTLKRRYRRIYQQGNKDSFSIF